MKCFYRFSDKGKCPGEYGYGINKWKCLTSYLNLFPEIDHSFILDSCEPLTIKRFENIAKSLQKASIEITSLGNSGSFKYILEKALNLPENEIVYFAEDDYFYKRFIHTDLSSILKEGLDLADYATLYDHGDKYPKFCKKANPYCQPEGELTVITRSKNIHWKYTNSTTMTFAVKVSTLYKDSVDMLSFLDTPSPRDFEMFTHLRNNKWRRIASSIPGYATHLSPDPETTSPFLHI